MFAILLITLAFSITYTHTNLIEANSADKLKRFNQMETDPLSNIAKDFTQKGFKPSKHHKEPTTHPVKKSKFKSYLQISHVDSSKNELLNEFLALKMYQYADKINMMTIPDFRIVLDSSVKIIKSETVEPGKKMNESFKIGTTSCNLERIAYGRSNSPIPVCPWHWVITEREDKYPFKRANARCNCVDCQAKTIYDSDLYRLSSCQPENILMPVLVREKLVNNTERWWFNMEEVPTSCICSLKLNPQV